MRISDWSSDVCSSDLTITSRRPIRPDGVRAGRIPVATQKGLAFVLAIPGSPRAQCPLLATGTLLTISGKSVRTKRRGNLRRDRLREIHCGRFGQRSEEHKSELQSLMRISYAVFCLQKKNHNYYEQPQSCHSNTIS